MAEMAHSSVGTCNICQWYRAAIRRIRSERDNSYLSRIYDRYDAHLDTHNTEARNAQA